MPPVTGWNTGSPIPPACNFSFGIEIIGLTLVAPMGIEVPRGYRSRREYSTCLVKIVLNIGKQRHIRTRRTDDAVGVSHTQFGVIQMPQFTVDTVVALTTT